MLCDMWYDMLMGCLKSTGFDRFAGETSSLCVISCPHHMILMIYHIISCDKGYDVRIGCLILTGFDDITCYSWYIISYHMISPWYDMIYQQLPLFSLYWYIIPVSYTGITWYVKIRDIDTNLWLLGMACAVLVIGFLRSEIHQKYITFHQQATVLAPPSLSHWTLSFICKNARGAEVRLTRCLLVGCSSPFMRPAEHQPHGASCLVK